MKFKLVEGLSREELEYFKKYIANICRIPTNGIMVFNNGRFEIHQVDERDASRMMSLLRRDDKLTNVNKLSPSYDFSHFTGTGTPRTRYTVTGTLKSYSGLYEFLSPILEENEQYHIRYTKDDGKWRIQVFNKSDEELQSVICDDIISRDRELEYLKNDYQTLDCCETK